MCLKSGSRLLPKLHGGTGGNGGKGPLKIFCPGGYTNLKVKPHFVNKGLIVFFRSKGLHLESKGNYLVIFV